MKTIYKYTFTDMFGMVLESGTMDRCPKISDAQELGAKFLTDAKFMNAEGKVKVARKHGKHGKINSFLVGGECTYDYEVDGRFISYSHGIHSGNYKKCPLGLIGIRQSVHSVGSSFCVFDCKHLVSHDKKNKMIQCGAYDDGCEL